MWVTGRNNFGQLGKGRNESVNMFVPVICDGVQAVATGGWHSMVLKADGSLWDTGVNLHGQLIGDGSTIVKKIFEKISSSLEGACCTVPLSSTIDTRTHHLDLCCLNIYFTKARKLATSVLSILLPTICLDQ